MIFNGEEVNFTLESYAQTTCLTLYRFYLLMKKLSDVLDSLTHDTDSENEFELPKTKRKFNINQIGNDSSSSAIEVDPTWPYQTTTLFESARSSAFTGSSVLATPSILSGHTTIGTSNETAHLREENERVYEESVRTDIERGRAARESEGDSNTSGENVSSNSLGPITYEDAEEGQECIELMNKRKKKTPKEPDIYQGPCVISVRHVSRGLIRRLFERESLMIGVYNWVDSLSPKPKYFELRNLQNYAVSKNRNCGTLKLWNCGTLQRYFAYVCNRCSSRIVRRQRFTEKKEAVFLILETRKLTGFF